MSVNKLVKGLSVRLQPFRYQVLNHNKKKYTFSQIILFKMLFLECKAYRYKPLWQNTPNQRIIKATHPTSKAGRWEITPL
jgi:hypothetical protein